jgi:hypothetical protein
MKLEYQNALKVVEGCIEEVQNLSRAQKKQYMLNKVSLNMKSLNIHKQHVL